MRRAVVLGSVLVGCVALAGEMGGIGLGTLAIPGPLSSRVGEWVTYRLDGGEGRASWWRMAVVGEERDDRGREAVWIEMEIGQDPELASPLAQVRMLVAREAGLSAAGVSRLQLAVGFDRPREVDPGAIPVFVSRAPRGAPAPSPWPDRVRTRTGPPSRVMTPAGTLTARSVELLLDGSVVRRFWLSREIPVLGLARMELPAVGQVMEVVDHGINARPRMAHPAPEAPQIHLER